MLNPLGYYIIAPIDGLHLDFDYRMYSAEIYGCPPDYKPNPAACPKFRQPYEYLGSFKFEQYEELSREWKIDDQTIQNLAQVPSHRLRDFTCIAFQIELDNPNYILIDDQTTNNSLFQHIIDKGERFLDVWRLCLFKPGEDFSIGSFGAIGNGIQCFWLGQDNVIPKFIARKNSRYQLIQKPVDVCLSEFGPIYADITFRGLSAGAIYYPSNEDIINRIFEALRAFRESRDIQSWEARFRHLAAIAESLAKKDHSEYLKGDKLRDRIATIATKGWNIYTHYGSSVLTPPNLPREQYRLIRERYEAMGWTDKDEAKTIVKDLWDNVRNPLTHTVSTVSTLARDPLKDMVNMERVVITMINGIHTAYEVRDLYEIPLYNILLSD